MDHGDFPVSDLLTRASDGRVSWAKIRNMPSYAIRTVYLFGVKPDGRNVFEERVVAFNAESWAEAHAKGEAEAERYTQQNDFVQHPEQSGYVQDGHVFPDGYEVWSELFESSAALPEFYAKRYQQFEYRSDDVRPLMCPR